MNAAEKKRRLARLAALNMYLSISSKAGRARPEPFVAPDRLSADIPLFGAV